MANLVLKAGPAPMPDPDLIPPKATAQCFGEVQAAGLVRLFEPFQQRRSASRRASGGARRLGRGGSRRARTRTTRNVAVRTALHSIPVRTAILLPQPVRDKIDRSHVDTSLRLLIVAAVPPRSPPSSRSPFRRLPLGSPLFFACSAVPCVVYALLARAGSWPSRPERSGRRAAPMPRLLIMALVLAAAFRVPLAVGPVGADNDMVRYIYDGRLQRLGYNPFEVVPGGSGGRRDAHRRNAARCRASRARTPYPAAAQLFFRLVVTIHESSRAMKMALVACDLLTICGPGRVAAVDAAIAVAGAALRLEPAGDPRGGAQRPHRRARRAVDRDLGVDAEHGPRHARGDRVRARRRDQAAADRAACRSSGSASGSRDAVVAALVLAALYFPFRSAGMLPLGAVPNVVAVIRFNGPLFKWLAIDCSTPQAAAAVARAGGLGVAAWMRCAAAGRRSGRVGLADGGVAGGRAGDLSVVPALLHAVPLHARDAAARRLDLFGAAGLRRLAPRRSSATGGSCRGWVDGASECIGSRSVQRC